jgi:RHS repeat-associated protein
MERFITMHLHAATGLSSIPEPYAAYDAMGNMTCRNTAAGTGHTCAGSTPTGATLTYDNEGRLSSWTAQVNKTGSDTFLYDGEGNRVLQSASSTTNGVTTVTDTITFDSYSEVTMSGGTTTTLTYYSLNGERLAVQHNTNLLKYLISDLLGSTAVAVNSGGTVVAVQLYWPYGSNEYSWGTMPTTYNFTGQRLDAVTSLLYFNARYYDPVSGRFTQADTVETNAKGMDPFAYVGCNPETFIDPTGNMYAPPGGGGSGNGPGSGQGQRCTESSCSVTIHYGHYYHTYSVQDLNNLQTRRNFLVDFYDEFAHGYGTAELDFFKFLFNSGRLIGSAYWNTVDDQLARDQLLAAFDFVNHTATQSSMVTNWLAFLSHPSNSGWWVAHNGSIDAGDQQARADGLYGKESWVEQHFINETIHVINQIQFVSQGSDNPLEPLFSPQGSTTGILSNIFYPKQYNDASTEQSFAFQGSTAATIGMVFGGPAMSLVGVGAFFLELT